MLYIAADRLPSSNSLDLRHSNSWPEHWPVQMARLCAVCTATDLENPAWYHNPTVILHATRLGRVEEIEGREKYCDFCAFIMTAEECGLRENRHASCELSSNGLVRFEGSSETISSIVVTLKVVEDAYMGPSLPTQASLEGTTAARSLFELQALQTPRSVSFPLRPTCLARRVEDQVSTGVIERWPKRCRSSHPKCQAAITSAATKHPSGR